jgi:hypothetical protein
MKRYFLSALAFGVLVGGAASAQDQPQADPNAAANPPVAGKTDDQGHLLARGANSFTEAQARHRIRKAGYAAVSRLTKDQDGLWQGTATRDGRSVHVAVDYKGDVSAQ